MNETPTAFPWTHDNMTCTGMTLRDYFAAKAMQGFAAMSDVDGFSSVEEMAKMSYKWADAMMKVRQA